MKLLKNPNNQMIFIKPLGFKPRKAVADYEQKIFHDFNQKL